MELSERLVQVVANISSGATKRIVAVCGAADLGKSYLSKQLAIGLSECGLAADHLTMDSFLIPRVKRAELGISGYDINAYDISSLRHGLEDFLNGKPFDFREYDHSVGAANGPKNTVSEATCLILDGLHSMHYSLMGLIDYSIFIYADDSRLNQIRHQADIEKRKQSVEFSLSQLEWELKSYKDHVEPYKYHANKLLELSNKWQYIEH